MRKQNNDTDEKYQLDATIVIYYHKISLSVSGIYKSIFRSTGCMYTHTRVGTLIVATIYLQLIQNRYMFRSFTVLQCSHQHCVQTVASDVEVVGYL